MADTTGGCLIRPGGPPVALRLVAVRDGGRDAQAHLNRRDERELAHAAHARVLPPGADRDGVVAAALVEGAEEALRAPRMFWD